MKKLFSLFFFVLCFSLRGTPGEVTKGQLQQAFKALDIALPIRVLLDEKNLSQVRWIVQSPSYFVIFAPHEKRKTVFQASQLMISSRQGSFVINGKKFVGSHLFILPLHGPISFQGDAFTGVFALTHSLGKAYLVNHLDLEDYVLAVIPREIWPGWPEEVQKVQCISARSYGIAKVLEQRAAHERSGRHVPYDIRNTNIHQVYKGCLRSDSYKKIVEETASIVLAHNNKPILAMFDTCCGGVIPARKNGIDFSKAPYLERTHPCYFCKDYKLYRWERSYPFEQIERELKKEFPRLGVVKTIKVSSRDAAGVAQKVTFKGLRNWYTIPASKFKSFLKDLPSLCFDFIHKGRSLTVSGKGHGHHMGLCQWGAYDMVRKGWKYTTILKFYYPHTTFMKLKRN